MNSEQTSAAHRRNASGRSRLPSALRTTIELDWTHRSFKAWHCGARTGAVSREHGAAEQAVRGAGDDVAPRRSRRIADATAHPQAQPQRGAHVHGGRPSPGKVDLELRVAVAAVLKALSAKAQVRRALFGRQRPQLTNASNSCSPTTVVPYTSDHAIARTAGGSLTGGEALRIQIEVAPRGGLDRGSVDSNESACAVVGVLAEGVRPLPTQRRGRSVKLQPSEQCRLQAVALTGILTRKGILM